MSRSNAGVPVMEGDDAGGPPPAHVRLFRRELIQLMNDEDFECLKRRYADRSLWPKLDEWYQRDDLRHEAKTCLFRNVAYSTDPNATTDLLRILAREQNGEFQRQLHLRTLPCGSYVRSPYMKLLFGGEFPNKMDRLAATLEPGPIVEHFRRVNSRRYDSLLERVEHYIKEKNSTDAACELLRSLPYSYTSREDCHEWYYDFLEACLSHGDTSFLPRYIDADYATDMAEHKAKREWEKNRDSREFNHQLNLNSELILSDDAPLPTKPRDPEDYRHYRVAAFDVGEVESEPYHLRAYQNELVAHANRGLNTIVCSPTGSGKTLVATDIIHHHLENVVRIQGGIGRAVMLVPTIPLVEQQTQRFLTHMVGQWWVEGISGADESRSRAGNLLAAHVVVMTPQILINMLNSVLKSEKVYITDFTLIIFDECHHCTGDHPYKVLMEMIETFHARPKPQIVGLTASMGVGHGSLDVNGCRNHMLELCCHLMAESISSVRRHIDELRRFVVPPVDQIMRAHRPANDEFVQLLSNEMRHIEMIEMKPLLAEVVERKLVPLLEKSDLTLPDHADRSRYEGRIASIKRALHQLQDETMRLTLYRCIDFISHYFHSIGVAEVLPYKYAQRYLDGKMEGYRTSASHSELNARLLDRYMALREKLVPMARSEEIGKKDILEKLYTIIHDQYQDQPDSRTLIFVRTRVCAMNLAEHLNDVMSRVKDLPMFLGQRDSIAGCLTSSNQTISEGGMSSELQRQTRDRFESGDLKILVVTSVAEEGIDIMQCNLIVKYNNVGSERSLIQRRGRARAKDSKSILLALDSSIEGQEFENMRKEALMLACIKDFQARPFESLQHMIATRREELERRKQKQMEVLLARKERLQSQRYRLSCRDCNALICDSMDIRSVGGDYYVCCDPSIYQRSRREAIKKATADGRRSIMRLAMLRCATEGCGREWGTVVNYAKVYLPALNAKAFVMAQLDAAGGVQQSEVERVEKWAKIQEMNFNIEPMADSHIRTMLNALEPRERTELAKLEAIAIQRTIDEERHRVEKYRQDRQNLRAGNFPTDRDVLDE